MLPYWILFAFPVWMALISASSERPSNDRWTQMWVTTFLLLVIMIGFRHQVGADWSAYLRHFNDTKYDSFQQAFSQTDPGYNLLNWVVAQFGLEIYSANVLCAVLFSWGLIEFCRIQPRPWLALVVAVPYLVIVVPMGYSRQGVAIGMVMLGLVALSNRKFFWFIFCIALGASFHKSAVLVMPLAAFVNFKNRALILASLFVFTLLLFSQLLEKSLETLNHTYYEAKYASSGAAIRVVMNAVPAGLFLVFRHRFKIADEEQSFWTIMSWLSLGVIVWFMLSPSSTAVDRVALFLIPLQLVVLSRLPDALGKKGGSVGVIVFGVVAYSALVLFVWLNFAAHSGSWLPYKFYPWVWLTE